MSRIPSMRWLRGRRQLYNNLGFYDIVAPGDSFPKAKAAAMRALAIDDSLAGARAALGYALLYYDWDWDGAEREMRRAIELFRTTRPHTSTTACS